MAFEWVAGLFQSDNQQARGLSGGSGTNSGGGSGIPLDDSNPYYNYRLRRHKAEGDLIADPGLLWYTSPYVKRRSGLGTHVGAEVGDGTANYTDVLLILSREDFGRASADWQAGASRALQTEFDNFCRRENFNRLHAHRPLGVRIIEDESTAMFGHSLQLTRGEFVTGLLPNLYTGPVRGSYPVIGVHLNLPGVWDGYQEVGRLHNDQILFTLGNHWLDNFSHPSLQQAALYRLRQYPDGSFVHIVNPDLQDQYQVTSTNQGGASVLTLATRTGQPLAYMVLAVIDPPANRVSKPPIAAGSAPTPVSANRRPDIQMPNLSGGTQPGTTGAIANKARDTRARPAGNESVPSIAPPMMLDDVVSTPIQKIGLGGKTIIPDAPSERIFTLQERGALLQKVHFSAFMLGYDVYLGSRGELGTHVEDPAATFQVRKRSVSLVAHVDGVLVEGRSIAAGVEVPIEGDVKIEVAGQKLEYKDQRGLQLDGWPYVGEIRRPASSTYMIWGEDYQVGRSRECRVVLPDEPRNDNIHWKPSVGDGTTIRARTGEIPKSRFYTDSIMVASEHASIDLRGEKPKVVCTARHCYAYIRRNNEVHSLYPTTSPQQPKEIELTPGDEILIGNCLFHVGYTAGEAIAPAPAPKLTLPGAQSETPTPNTERDGSPSPTRGNTAGLSEALSGAVAAPDLENLDSDTIPPIPSRVGQPPAKPETKPANRTDTQRVSPRMERGFLSDPPPPGPPPEDVPGSIPPPPIRTEPGYDSIVDGSFRVSPPLAPANEPTDDEPTVSGLLIRPIGGQRPLLDKTAPGTGSGATLDRWEDDITGDPDAEPAPPDVGGWDSDEWPPGEEDEVSLTGEPPTRDPQELTDQPPPPRIVEPVEPTVAREDPATGPITNPVTAPIAAVANPVTGPVVAPPPMPTVRTVVFIDDAEAQFEIGRPLHLVLAGWMVNGDVMCGNHVGCQLVIPENRIRLDQELVAREYFRLRVRGRKGTVEILSPSEVDVDEASPRAVYEDPEAHTFDVIRRDDAGERDFAVRLKLVEDRRLPDPRARFVSLDTEDPLAGALVTRGLPKGAPRTLELDGVRLTFLFDGTTIKVSDYLDTYRPKPGSDVFHPFFVQRGEERFKTAPEDGAAFLLKAGDRMVIGPCVYVLREE